MHFGHGVGGRRVKVGNVMPHPVAFWGPKAKSFGRCPFSLLWTFSFPSSSPRRGCFPPPFSGGLELGGGADSSWWSGGASWSEEVVGVVSIPRALLPRVCLVAVFVATAGCSILAVYLPTDVATTVRVATSEEASPRSGTTLSRRSFLAVPCVPALADGPSLCLGGCVLRCCFRFVFDSAGSAGVVSGPTLVVGRGITLFRCFVVLCSRALFARLTPLLSLRRDSLSQEFVAGRSWWQLVRRAWLAFQQGPSVSYKRVLLLLLSARAASVVAIFAHAAVGFILCLRIRVVVSRRLREPTCGVAFTGAGLWSAELVEGRTLEPEPSVSLLLSVPVWLLLVLLLLQSSDTRRHANEATETPEASLVLSRLPSPSRSHRDGKGNRDKRQVATGLRVGTKALSRLEAGSRHTLIAMANRAVIRLRPTKAMPPLCRDAHCGRDISREADRRNATSRGHHNTLQLHIHGEGSMGKAVKACNHTKGLPITRIGRAQKIPTDFTKNEPKKSLHEATAASSSLLAALPLHHEPPALPPSSNARGG
ncbi:hypothetical protein Taro_017036 [Colocasia esculenta]|uniref:Transmembrane protein n=1 Tax=Colocasia esculenta TaxID=4460 RepID=A0A843UQ57_COLES|nr:hypothetical protein [Colocasia esculenta]